MTNPTDLARDDAVVIVREFDAPVGRLWELWTVPDRFAAWYGPNGATIPVAEMDVRVGGGRRICMEMTTPNGAMQMWYVGEYREIDPPHRLVYTEAMADSDGNVLAPESMGMPAGFPVMTEITVVLEPSGTGTRMTMTHAGIPADSPGASGWQMAFDKLTTLTTAG